MREHLRSLNLMQNENQTNPMGDRKDRLLYTTSCPNMSFVLELAFSILNHLYLFLAVAVSISLSLSGYTIQIIE